MAKSSQGDGSVSSTSPVAVVLPSVKLLDRVRAKVRRLGLAIRTEEAYVGWIRRFILANDKRHPSMMGEHEVEAFLSNLAVHGRVARSTQNQALAALLFLHREVFGIKLPWMDSVIRAKRSQRVPTVLSRDEVTRLLAFQQPLTSAVIGTRE